MEIVEFLMARLDEDEQVARDASGDTIVGQPGAWEPSPAGDEWEATCTDGYDEELLVALRPGLPRPPDIRGGRWGAIVSTNPDRRGQNEASPMGAFRHAARHDPARVLREVAAKRAIIEQHPNVNDGDCGTCVVGAWGYPTHGSSRPASWPCPTLRHLAAPHAEHPDYNESWRP